MLNEEAIREYLKERFRGVERIDIAKLGSGVQGSGFLIDIHTPEEVQSYVIKTLFSKGLGHDYPADRASVFLLDLDEYKNLPQHVRAIDVLSEKEDGSVLSVGGGKEYYLLMERVQGTNYFHDLRAMGEKQALDKQDRKKIEAMASYLAQIHSVKEESRALYWRKVRDTIGHGECLMGVFDTYPDGVISYEAMAEIEKRCIDWRARLKPKTHRLCQIHGDFHPGNIWFDYTRGAAHEHEGDFILLDRSRGPWGDAADDVTALTINYLFFSLQSHGTLRDAYEEGMQLFFSRYLEHSGDQELSEVLAPFYAFRGAVVANPVFYPDISSEVREKIFNFVRSVLDSPRFEVERINEYIVG